VQAEIVATGIGVTTAIGQGKEAFTSALLRGAHAFGVMRRPGRQSGSSAFLGAEIAALAQPSEVSNVRTASFSARVAVATLYEAWRDAALDDVDPERIGLIVGGSNFQQRELALTHDSYAGRVEYLGPSYGMTFADTDLCALCTSLLGIRGMACTIGGASASGQLAIIQAIQSLQAGQVDVCVVLGALMDLSYWECQGLRALGAMGSDRYAAAADLACRPFDRDRDGFIFGECCGAIVLEKLASRGRTARPPYARVAGWGMVLDGNRGPAPSLEGERRAIRIALKRANRKPERIDYVNPHGTSSQLGDAVELEAIESCGLSHAYLNATKSLIGHGLSAAGTVEAIATLLQMRAGRLHPTRNLDNPINPSMNWVRDEPVAHTIENALTLSIGSGGINTAICLQRCE
jgi:malonyl-ACP decarboxylase